MDTKTKLAIAILKDRECSLGHRVHIIYNTTDLNYTIFHKDGGRSCFVFIIQRY